ncbi:MAG: target of Sbf [Pleopsidium flavum]|nr:MAG: target of Sbf [Pleopsidium flavum]
MRNLITAGAVVIVAITSGVAGQKNCANGPETFDNKNYYCSPVKSIHYSNVSNTGSYDRVTHMDVSSGTCMKEPHQRSGAMAPLNEELSMHFRGPLRLKKFAVYTPGSSKKRSVKPSIHHRRHDHQHFHEHNKEIREIQEREAKGEEVRITSDGKVQTWINQYDGLGGAAATSAPGAPAAASQVGSATPTTKAVPAAPSFNAGSGTWGRQAYYSAADGTADGLVFLNNKGSCPDNFDSYKAFGAPLSYASGDGSSSANSPQILKDVLLEDPNEIMIFSDKKCSDGDCGYVRPESVGYHGFGGAKKAFLMEFSMPLSGKNGLNLDMPSVWLLNTRIPQTQQYGSCSCWDSGCGEFDLFEVLDSGNTRCKSTIHMGDATKPTAGKSGGDSDYFQRPTSGTITAIVVFTGDNGSAHIKVLDDGHSFDTTLGANDIEEYCKIGDDKDTSVFQLG